MRLRFVEDRRSLFWAFVLFPSVPIAVYLRPSLGPWLLPFALYLSYCAGVLTHNQNHCPTFAGKRANLFYGAWLSFFYGFPIFSWVPTHNQNHHRYVNAEGDATRTTKLSPRNALLVALIYPLASSRWQFPGLKEYVLDSARGKPQRFRRIVLEATTVILGHAALLALALGLHGGRTGVLSYTLSLGIPALTATYWMMFTNFVQHTDCDASSPDNHSRNFVSPFFNWFVFENGLHTVHHEHPGVHWSRYRALHEARAGRILPQLNQNSLFGYVFEEYVVKAFANARRGLLRSLLPTVTRAKPKHRPACTSAHEHGMWQPVDHQCDRQALARFRIEPVRAEQQREQGDGWLGGGQLRATPSGMATESGTASKQAGLSSHRSSSRSTPSSHP